MLMPNKTDDVQTDEAQTDGNVATADVATKSGEIKAEKVVPEQRVVSRQRRSMILPEAYDSRAMPALQLTRSSRLARRIGRVLTALLVLGFILMAFAPWQQSVRGSGSVIAFTPRDRPQTIEAPIKGRLVEWGEGVYENAHVEEGQLICRIEDLDASLLDRLDSQVETIRGQIKSLNDQIDADTRGLAQAELTVTSLMASVNSMESAKDQVVAAAEAEIVEAENKVESENQKLKEIEAAVFQNKEAYDRQQRLFDRDIIAEVKLQEAQQKYNEALAKKNQAVANIKAAKASLLAKQRARDAKESEAQGKIDTQQSYLDKARGEANKAESSIAKAQGDLEKARKELIIAQSKFAQQEQQEIYAPFDGSLAEIMPNQGSSMLKPGDPIALIVPDTADRAVQIWLEGNDAPLVTPGRHVRLQFEGWPAVQFAGWPSVAVGTFGGTVVSVNETDNGKGKFRMLVRPDDESGPWPDDRYLRQGVRANGWALLEKVPLWFEVWRNMNGFPPVVDNEPEKLGKVPKLPK